PAIVAARCCTGHGHAQVLSGVPPMNARTGLPDLSHLWMPFTANRNFKSQPRMLADAKGMYYTSTDGRQILDGTSGLWCVNAGHCRDEIVQAIASQAGTLD